MLTGLMLCAHMWFLEGRPSPFGRWDVWDDRLDILIPFDREKQFYVGFSTSRLFAAALAPLIASPHWRRLAGGTEAEQAPGSSRRSRAASPTPTTRPTGAATPSPTGRSPTPGDRPAGP
ncbi:hypothetical protein [Streptomyces buecherae]|uniref:Uncharacterized protein n=1 Tax=Streptomyces buecherae TaxID=2763006 RepID=A0A7H8NGI6_9ACTN|nr:hypothetical protein [Streptomyces buecherae]QKW53571.1 hypothetical protein HUT08_33000 [Streptomyces buecherae]